MNILSMFQIYWEIFKQWFSETFNMQGVKFYSEQEDESQSDCSCGEFYCLWNMRSKA